MIAYVTRLLCGIGLIIGSSGMPLVAADKPNIVCFVVDDLGFMDVQPNNPDCFYDTPHLKRLAESGLRFTSGYAACPVCSPTRASLITGKYPQRTGITDYIGAPQPDAWKRPTKLLPAPYRDRLLHEETTFAESLKKGGYATLFAGKWHLGPEGFWPETQGFDFNHGGIDRGGPYGGNKYFSPYGNPRLANGPDGEHLPDRLATETAKFIESHHAEPFLAYFCFYSVHTPLMARDDLKLKYEERAKKLAGTNPKWGKERERAVRQVQDHAVYAGMVEAMDQAVGKVLDTIDRLGLTDKTVVIFTSDNGGLSTSEGHPTSNLPLRAGKGWMYEGGIRVPWIIRAPGLTKPGQVCDTPIMSMDLYPTLMELAGVPTPASHSVDGVSLVRLLSGDDLKPRPLFWHYPHYGNQGGAPGGAVRDGDWKLIEWYEDGSLELFNLKTDLGETTNLAGDMPDKVRELREQLEKWRSEVDAVMPRPNPKSGG
ncbi:MAG: sulfatase [Schlesneria sp.]